MIKDNLIIKEFLWEEIDTILRLGDVKLVSFLGLLSTSEDCRRMLDIRLKGRINGAISWDALGLEILKNLGLEEGKKVLMQKSVALPKGSFSARFYREVIRQSLLEVL